MKTVAASVLIAAACFLVVAEAQTTLKPSNSCSCTCGPTTLNPVTTTKPITTTTKPTTKPITTTTMPTTRPITTTIMPTTKPVTTLKPITTLMPVTTFKPATVTTPKPVTTQNPATTKPGSTLAPVVATDYCNIKTCSVPTSNSLCKYTNTSFGAACLPPYPAASTVSAADITTILKAHNDYRRKVAQGLETLGNPGPQPPASNIRELKWDQELSVMAAAWAQQCIYQHDTCRDVPRFRVGQNLYIGASSADNLGTSNWNDAITGWYDEVQYMNIGYVNALPASPTNTIGHYTQLVWADTYLVGCATVYYQSTTVFGPSFPYNRLYACNYGPTGNWLNSPVYSQGTAGSACPSGTANNNGLCA